MSSIHYHSTDKIGLHDDYSINVCTYKTESGPKVGVSVAFRDGHAWLPGDADTVAMLRAAANSLEDSLSALAGKEVAA